MKTGFYLNGDHFLIVHFRIVIILHFIVCDLAIIIHHIFADIYIVILFLAAIQVCIVIRCIVKFVLDIISILIFMTFFIQFQCRVLFQFFLDALFQIGSRYLQQFH